MMRHAPLILQPAIDREMLGRLFAMLRNCTWIFENLDAVEAAQSAFDYRNAA